MNIIKNIIEELIQLVENNKIKYSFSTYEDSCTITFGKREITISNFYNMEQKYFYYQIAISSKQSNLHSYDIVIESKNVDLFEKTRNLYELVKLKFFESDQNLQSILEELKTGIFEEDGNKSTISQDNFELPSDGLPF